MLLSTLIQYQRLEGTVAAGGALDILHEARGLGDIIKGFFEVIVGIVAVIFEEAGGRVAQGWQAAVVEGDARVPAATSLLILRFQVRVVLGLRNVVIFVGFVKTAWLLLVV